MNKKSNFDLSRYLVEKNIKFSTTTGSNFELDSCPECGKDGGGHFYIKSTKGKSILSSHPYWCHKCGAAGNIINFIELINGISKNMAIKFLLSGDKSREYSHLDRIEKKIMSVMSFEKEITKLKEISMLSEFNFLAVPIDYTEQRGLTIEAIKYFDIHFCYQHLYYESILKAGFVAEDSDLSPDQIVQKYSKLYLNRVILPVRLDGRLVGWQGRTINNKIKPKYLNSPHFKKSKALYNYDIMADKTFASKSDAVILCEGPFDAIACWMAGYKAVAAFGKSVSMAQIGLLVKAGVKKLILGLDPDAVVESDKLYKDLGSLFDVSILPLPDGMDLGDCNIKMIDDLMGKLKKPYLEGIKRKSL